MNNEKWTCSFCTYVNWSASQRCVICQNENIVNQLNQEIYNLEIAKSDNTQLNNVIQNQNLSDTRNKWACLACTYFNWPKARKCVQCNTCRYKHSSPTLSQQSLSSDEQYVNTSPRSHSRHKIDKETENESKIKQKSDDGKATSSDHVAATDSPHDTVTLTKALQKWICQSCTYENWPKSKICIMCKVARNCSKNINRMHSPDRKVSPQVEPNTENPALTTEPSRRNLDRQSLDILWLEACTSVLNGNLYTFESYLLAMDGNLDRKLTVQDCRILNQPEIFTPSLTLLDLACKLSRDDFIELYLSTPCNTNQPSSTTRSIKHRMPCHISPDRALAIKAHLYDTMRQRKGDFPCYIVQDHSTFWLPAEIELLPLIARCQLFDELVDKNVLRELEINEKVINWWAQNSSQNRLTALWNRTAGDCLLDSVLQSTWGILDRDNILRTALADSMREAQHIFYPRWREYERIQARTFNYTINEIQFHRDWQNLLQIACQQGEPLEQVHIFVLCHIIRRPIIVYGIKFINNHRNEPVGLSHFQGVYLPLLWEKSFCSRIPIVLGYTRGHFSALVPSESLLTPISTPAKNAALRSHPGTIMRGQMTHDSAYGGISSSAGSCLGGLNNYGHCLGENLDQTVQLSMNSAAMCLLPLYDCNKQLLPIHFLTDEETQRSETLLRDWLDVAITRRGYLMARMRSARRHPLVASLIEVWLERYRPLTTVDHHEYEEHALHRSPRQASVALAESVGACSQTSNRQSPVGAHYSSAHQSDQSDTPCEHDS